MCMPFHDQPIAAEARPAQSVASTRMQFPLHVSAANSAVLGPREPDRKQPICCPNIPSQRTARLQR